MIYFIRHGQSQANLDDIFAGQGNDSPLTELGRQQAAAAGQAIVDRGTKVDRIISSPLSRTRDTARIIAEKIGFDPAQIVFEPRLLEYDMGQLTGQPHRHLHSSQVTTAPGVEDVAVFQERIMAALSEIKQLPGNTLIVSHAGVGQMIECTKQKRPPEEFYDIPAYPNGAIEVIQ